MAACEPCWNEAYRQSRMLGGSQADYYRRLLCTVNSHPQDTPTPTQAHATTEPDGGDADE